MTDEPFIPETEDDDEVEAPVVATQPQKTAQAQQRSETSVDNGFEERFLNDKWYGRYKLTQQYMKHLNNTWLPIDEEEYELVQQLWMEQEAEEIQEIKGVKCKYNFETKEWEPLPVEIDEDFIAAYQSNYGVQYDYDQMTEQFRKEQEAKQKEREEKKEEKKKRKAAEELKPEGWIEMDERISAVYVSNLPLDIDEEEFKEFMSKAGVIKLDARTHKPKIKLYRADDGGLKGDGRCSFVRIESVEIALHILDGALFKDKEVKVEKAHFELKGEYDPSKKPKKMTAAQKKNYIERQKKVFEWKPDKPRNYRPISDCTVIISNLFTIEELNKTPALLFDIKQDLETSCSKFGKVKKVVVYDNNPDGVCSVAFETTVESDQAVKMLDGRVVKGKTIKAHHWDGRTRYKREETAEERAAREAEWDRFVGQDSDEEEDEEHEEEAPNQPK